MEIKVLRQVKSMLGVDKVKEKALEVGAQAGQFLVEKALEAVKAVEARIEAPVTAPVEAPPEPVTARPVEPSPQLREQINATAARVLEEAQAVEQRLRDAKPARHPLMKTETDGIKSRRTLGRKTAISAAAPQSPVAAKSGFKAKRGQKHSH